MKMQTIELTGAVLDWAVLYIRTYAATCGSPILTGDLMRQALKNGMASPSTDWAQGGPIIERGGIAISPHDTLGWAAFQSHTAIDGVIYKDYFGPTPLIAAMRCYVASKLGDTVDVPDELNP